MKALVAHWGKALFLGMALWVALPETAAAQIIGKEKKKIFFWQRNKDLVDLSPADTMAVLDSLGKPSLAVATKDSLAEVEKDNKKSKKKKAYFGYRVKKGFARQGKGKNQIVETFHYLREFQQPNPYVPEKYYFDVKKRDVLRTFNFTLKPNQAYILHGPYTRMRGDVVIEQGYFYVGTKHLRWETFRTDSTLASKLHYEKGFPRDAVISYYDAAKTKIKEVIPYQYGEVQGQYLKYYENGQLEWRGTYDKGKKVGTWSHFYDYRGRLQHEFQYPESAYDKPAEPILTKHYDAYGVLVYEKKD
jgi:antitoxin component YwqK of YwqJK toxin-antitoxin module